MMRMLPSIQVGSFFCGQKGFVCPKVEHILDNNRHSNPLTTYGLMIAFAKKTIAPT